MKLPIAYYGDPVLRKKCIPIQKIDDELRQFVTDMKETMFAYNGVGLAAPQVHRTVAVFITCEPVEGADGKYSQGEPKVYINPRLFNPSVETCIMEDGCLSVPKFYPFIERPYSIDVEAMDLDGKIFVESLVGYGARIVMHENDHLNGVLSFDRLPPQEKKKAAPILREIQKKYYHPAKK